MTNIEFTTEELGLIKRVLAFATHDVPITDLMGNKLFPTFETRALALSLENRLEESGIPTPGQLFSAYDPEKLVNKVATVRWFSDHGVEYNVRGVVSEVRPHDAGAWTVVFKDGGEFFFESRDELQKNSRVELEQDPQ